MSIVNRHVGSLTIERGLVLQAKTEIERDRAGVETSTFLVATRRENYPSLLPARGTSPTTTWPTLADRLAAYATLGFDGAVKVGDGAPGVVMLSMLYKGATITSPAINTTPDTDTGLVVGSLSVPYYFNSGNSIGQRDVSYRGKTRSFRYVSTTEPTTPRYALIAATVGTFTVDAGTDIFTLNNHGLVANQRVEVSSTTTLPAGLSSATGYRVRDVTTNTFKLSASFGGSAINITDTGTGTHTLSAVPVPLVDGNEIGLPYCVSFGGGTITVYYEPRLVLTNFNVKSCGNYFEVIEEDQVKVIEVVSGYGTTGA